MGELSPPLHSIIRTSRAIGYMVSVRHLSADIYQRSAMFGLRADACPIMTPTNENVVLSLNKVFTLQDGRMNSIAISESSIDDDIIITQNSQNIYVPKQHLTAFIRTLQKIESDGRI